MESGECVPDLENPKKDFVLVSETGTKTAPML